MMGRRSGQLKMNFMDIGELVPKNYSLRKIDETINFDFIYQKGLCIRKPELLPQNSKKKL